MVDNTAHSDVVPAPPPKWSVIIFYLKMFCKVVWNITENAVNIVISFLSGTPESGL